MARKNEELDLIVRAVNVDSQVWADAQVIAKKAGLTMSELVRNVLKLYVETGSQDQ